ncbi:MAG: DUF433 domain-containing protein [Deltaproteobacteria bacterium]|nr:DUF433 domain-containing protein [Deltaproteobacteria bacterium]
MQGRIEIDQTVHFGKPCIAGTRIPVYDVLELMKEGISFEQVIADYYPDLTRKDLEACVQYAMDVIEAEEIHVSAGGP